MEVKKWYKRRQAFKNIYLNCNIIKDNGIGYADARANNNIWSDRYIWAYLCSYINGSRRMNVNRLNQVWFQ